MVHDSIAAFDETGHLRQRQRESLVKRTLFISSAIVFLTASSMASAQVTVDVSKITCDEFVKYEIADPKRIAIWISGYYHGIHNNPIVDKHQTLQMIDKLEEYCFKHPNDLVMKEVDELLGAQ
jgi:acid stress chaperone HdeB